MLVGLNAADTGWLTVLRGDDRRAGAEVAQRTWRRGRHDTAVAEQGLTSWPERVFRRASLTAAGGGKEPRDGPPRLTRLSPSLKFPVEVWRAGRRFVRAGYQVLPGLFAW